MIPHCKLVQDLSLHCDSVPSTLCVAPATMKFKTFDNPLLNLGSMDIELASQRQLSLLICAACGFTSEAMFYSNCNHVFCPDCLLLLEPANDQQGVVDSHCLLCQCTSSAMIVQVKESFVAQLECVCPQCRITLRLCELKTHLKSCKILLRPSCSLSLNEKSAAKQNTEDAPSLGDHSSSATSNDGENAEQTMSDSGSQQWAVSSSVTAAISAVRTEVIDMMSNDKNELRSEFMQKIEAVSNSVSSITTQSQSRQRSFELVLKQNPLFADNLYRSNVCINDVKFAFQYNRTTNEITATIRAIGDMCVPSIGRTEVPAAVEPHELNPNTSQAAPKPLKPTTYLKIGNKIKVAGQAHNHGRACNVENSSSCYNDEYVVAVSVKFDWTSMTVQITALRFK